MAAPQTSGRSPRRRATRLGAMVGAAAVVVVALALVAINLFGSSPAPTPAAAEPTVTIPPTTTTTAPPPPPSPSPSPIAASTTIAQVDGPVPFSTAPGGPQAGTIPVGSWWGTTKYLPVIGQVPGWIDVRLPQRPNGLTGWIPSASAQLTTTSYGILIDVTARRVRLYNGGVVVADFPAGVGTVTDPTPLGQFYVMGVEKSPGPSWGPFIVDTNAHSEAITSWEGSGDAFTALHGPIGADAAIGTTGAAISHGCVRMHNADLAQLQPVPPGAPIAIVA
jgi:lipoprotein-anchoring transpeptidase ErfK/SrfK